MSFCITSWPAGRKTEVKAGRLKYGSDGNQSGGNKSNIFMTV